MFIMHAGRNISRHSDDVSGEEKLGNFQLAFLDDECTDGSDCPNFEVVEEIKVNHGLFVTSRREIAETFFHQVVPSQIVKVQNLQHIMSKPELAKKLVRHPKIKTATSACKFTDMLFSSTSSSSRSSIICIHILVTILGMCIVCLRVSGTTETTNTECRMKCKSEQTILDASSDHEDSFTYKKQDGCRSNFIKKMAGFLLTIVLAICANQII